MSALKANDDFGDRPHRPARYRLFSKNGIPHGTFKTIDEAREEAKRMVLGDPNTSDDEPNGWYVETTKASKVHKRRAA